MIGGEETVTATKVDATIITEDKPTDLNTAAEIIVVVAVIIMDVVVLGLLVRGPVVERDTAAEEQANAEDVGITMLTLDRTFNPSKMLLQDRSSLTILTSQKPTSGLI
jgi:hypothetical protein